MFLPLLGYDRCSDLLKEFDKSGRENLREFLEEKIGKDKVSQVLAPQNLVSLGYRQ